MELSQLLCITNQITHWLADHYIELFGTVSGLLYVYLEIEQKSAMWIVGFFTSVTYVIVFFQSKIYADMGLNVYYVVISIYGWCSWRYAAKHNDAAGERSISRIKWQLSVILLIISVVLFVVMGYMLDNFTDSPVPYYDALITALSITATWMLARKILEHWYLWIFINFFSSVLYLWRELYPTAVLFVVYGVMSFVGRAKWQQSFNVDKNDYSPYTSLPDSHIS